MRRREFLGLFGGLSTTIVSGAARGEALKRVALVSVGSTPVTQMHGGSTSVYFRTFFEELRRLGYVEGKNLVILRFTSGGQSERIPDTAREVVAATPDVIFAFTSRMVQQLKTTTTSIPVVGYTADPISFGIVEDLSHPGKNITGVATEASSEFDGKRLSLFRESSFPRRRSRPSLLLAYHLQRRVSRCGRPSWFHYRRGAGRGPGKSGSNRANVRKDRCRACRSFGNTRSSREQCKSSTDS
jgi:hypothetical protein